MKRRRGSLLILISAMIAVSAFGLPKGKEYKQAIFWAWQAMETAEGNWDDIDSLEFAQDLITKAIEINPGEPLLYFRKAKIHCIRGEFDKALQTLHRGERMGGFNVLNKQFEAMIQDYCGDSVAANLNYHRALSYTNHQIQDMKGVDQMMLANKILLVMLSSSGDAVKQEIERIKESEFPQDQYPWSSVIDEVFELFDKKDYLCHILGVKKAEYNRFRWIKEAYTTYPFGLKYDNNNIREIGNFISTKKWTGQKTKHGKVVKCNIDDVVESISTYDRGVMYGMSEHYYPDGKLKAKGKYNGRTQFNINEVIQDNGLPDSTWTYYRPDGTVDDVRTYDHGNLVSSKKYRLCFDAKMMVYDIATDSLFNGELQNEGIVPISGSQYEEDILFPFIYTGQVASGLLDGLIQIYYDIKKQKTLFCTGEYRKGKAHSLIRSYYPNGEIMSEITYDNGVLDGAYKSYHSNSVVYLSCAFKNGKLHGTYKRYHPNGLLAEESHYIDGKRTGISPHL